MKPKILIYDCEVSPMLAWEYQYYEGTALKVERQSYMFCFSYMWLGDKSAKCVSQVDFPARYKAEPYSDYDVAKTLNKLMDEADIVIAYNGIGFDNKVANTRFLVHGLPVPSPYKTIDPLRTDRSKFKFANNKLGDVCTQLGLGKKSEETHADLWYDCINGDKTAWQKMIKYCKNDTILLRDLYLKLRPYITNHPNIANYSQRPDTCPKCGHDRLQRRGLEHTNTMSYYRYQCMNCGGWVHERLADIDSEKPTYKN